MSVQGIHCFLAYARTAFPIVKEPEEDVRPNNSYIGQLVPDGVGALLYPTMNVHRWCGEYVIGAHVNNDGARCRHMFQMAADGWDECRELSTPYPQPC